MWHHMNVCSTNCQKPSNYTTNVQSMSCKLGNLKAPVTVDLLVNVSRAWVLVGHSYVNYGDHQVSCDTLHSITELVIGKILILLNEGYGSWTLVFALKLACWVGLMVTSVGRRVMVTSCMVLANVSAAVFIELAIDDMPSPMETQHMLRCSAPIVPVPALLVHLQAPPSLTIGSSCMIISYCLWVPLMYSPCHCHCLCWWVVLRLASQSASLVSQAIKMVRMCCDITKDKYILYLESCYLSPSQWNGVQDLVVVVELLEIPNRMGLMQESKSSPGGVAGGECQV